MEMNATTVMERLANLEEKMAVFDARLKDIEEILSNLTLTLQNHLK